MKLKYLGLGIVAITLSGCFPMEQAPLVYSSKNQFGVNVSAGTPDSPGLDVNIGFKALDSAFVPVAVAKRCRGEPGIDCTSPAFHSNAILGSNDVTGAATVDERMVEKFRTDIAAGRAERITKLQDLEVANSSLEQLKSKPAKEGELAALRSPSIDPGTQAPRALTDAENARLQELQADVTKLSSLDAKTLQARADTLKAEVGGIDQRLADLNAQLERQITLRNENTGDLKKDALSLFGSFNGSASGKSDGARLGLGKIFATGVAAQQIAQSVGEAASPATLVKCLERAEGILRLVPDAEKGAISKQLLEACGAVQ